MDESYRRDPEGETARTRQSGLVICADRRRLQPLAYSPAATRRSVKRGCEKHHTPASGQLAEPPTTFLIRRTAEGTPISSVERPLFNKLLGIGDLPEDSH